MKNMNAATIGGFQLLDFAAAPPRKSSKIVSDHKKWYQGQAPAYLYYGQLYAGLRAAANAVDPKASLDRVVARAAGADASKGQAYQEAASGFLRQLPPKASGVPVKSAAWVDGDLTVEMRRMIGLRQANGKLIYVAPYAKATPLTQADADVLLYMMETAVPEALPGAEPQVWDLRQGTVFKLRQNTNRKNLECHVRGVAAAYMVAWNLAA